MPEFRKSDLSRFLSSKCERQLQFNLYPSDKTPERAMRRIPPKQPPMTNYTVLQALGVEWETAKCDEIVASFGVEKVHRLLQIPPADKPNQKTCYGTMDLTPKDMLRYHAGEFVVQAHFKISDKGTFARAFGLEKLSATRSLQIKSVIPDILMLLPSVRMEGEAPITAVNGRGQFSVVDDNDARVGIRVIDIKMTAEANTGYFAEVSYYTLALAGMLDDWRNNGSPEQQEVARQFYVRADCAVWPGAEPVAKFSLLSRQRQEVGESVSFSELRGAFEEELEFAPLEIFAQRIRRFFEKEVPVALDEDWQELPWHADSRCHGCDYLGMHHLDRDNRETRHEDHCLPMAARKKHLSMVPFLSRGARRALEEGGIKTVPQLAALSPSAPQMKLHQGLRTKAPLIIERAKAICEADTSDKKIAYISPEAETSATMPRSANLSIYVGAYFDIGSRFSIAFSLQAKYSAPLEERSNENAGLAYNLYDTDCFLVQDRHPDAERLAFRDFLLQIKSIIGNAELGAVEERTGRSLTYQIYFWNRSQYSHVCRVAGRHPDLAQDPDVKDVLFLFPSNDELMAPEIAGHSSPVTILKDVIQDILVLSVAHEYTLLSVANTYAPRDAGYNVLTMFDGGLSDNIPSEQAHEFWMLASSAAENSAQRREDLNQRIRRTLKTRQSALLAVTTKLSRDMGERLTARPPYLHREKPKGNDRLNADSRVWHDFSRLNVAQSKMGIEEIRAMPAYEREARFKSARLTARLEREQEIAVLERMKLDVIPGRRVYRLSEGSLSVSLKPGESKWSIRPENDHTFFRQSVQRLTAHSGIDYGGQKTWKMEDATAVTVVQLDRIQGLIILDAEKKRPDILDELERAGINLSHRVSLDQRHVGSFEGKLLSVLAEVGKPDVARRSCLTGTTSSSQEVFEERSAPSAISEFLWNPCALAEAKTSMNVDGLLRDLKDLGIGLNAAQESALRHSLTSRLHLIWGPPGTGKSHTIITTLIAAMIDAARANRKLRILVTAFTWSAIDNVIQPLFEEIQSIVGKGRMQRLADVKFHRLRSERSEPSLPEAFMGMDTPFNWRRMSRNATRLRDGLTRPLYSVQSSIFVVGATADQVFNLVKSVRADKSLADLFDFVIIDEASQMDVAHAIVALSGLSRNGSVLCAGDWLQLAPIQETLPPDGMEYMVGSVYDFLRNQHGVPQTQLDVNYRSNGAIVSFFKQAGYPVLSANSDNLAIRYKSALPTTRPADWPEELVWSPHFAEILNPAAPITCIVYPDGKSSQWNDFEAQNTAAMTYLLSSYLEAGYAQELDHSGRLKSHTGGLYSPEEFWNKGLGIVTPHRAQQSLVLSELERVFENEGGHSPSMMRSSVDTVERFQGQQRAVIIASFGVGDPDTISGEDEFLLSLNRFNVLASRARAKLVVFITEELAGHISSDPEVMRQSRLLKAFSEHTCPNRKQIELPCRKGQRTEYVETSLRWLNDGQAFHAISIPPKAVKKITAAEQSSEGVGSPKGNEKGLLAALEQPVTPRTMAMEDAGWEDL